MAGELIRLDHKHNSIEQMKMAGGASWTQNSSSLIERWRPEAHTFHLLCGKCTIILEDVQLQLGLLVDGSALTEFVQSTDWGAVCHDLLGAIPNNIYGGRIKIDCLKNTFPELGNDLTELANLVGGLPCWQHYTKRWNHLASYVGIPTALEDIQLLLDQRLEAQFQWTSYKDLTIRAIIPDEFFQNPNIQHVKVPLVNYAAVEMHQMSRVLRVDGRWDGKEVIITGGIAQGTVEELISLPIPITLGIQTPPPWVMQTPPHSLFYQSGLSSQHSQPEQPQPPPEAEPKRNPAHNRRPLYVALIPTSTYIIF
ncbi:hypothetical protein CXB51_034338 [Gossypium anomalum]|uniref:Aminotransferase-like plant mobile domain-containing protein n=1 Tax=Gossypium anomalum TaxID=47600 RepID=A0A8J5Y4W6_9ROSI|nr:hypothetical protein CXB51_034338 [Gossypium anomalum]